MESDIKELCELFTHGQLSRRDFVQKGLELGLTMSSIGLFLYNSTPTLAASSRHAAIAPRKGGTLRAADSGPTPGGLDPAVQQDTATIAICHNIYDFLVRLDNHLVPYPDLATKWVPSPDGLTWTFPLRQGVKFHSGKALTSADVVYSLNRIKTLGLGGASLLTNVTKLDAPDDYTVVVHLKAPNPDLPAFLADYHMCIVENNFDPTMKAGYSKFTSAPSGTGPFMFKDFVPADHATIVRHPHYWDQPYPYLDSVKFLYLPQQTTQVAAVQSGQVDFVLNLSPVQAAPLVGSPGVKVFTLPGPGFLNMRMRSDRKPFSDPRVRNAFKYMVDRQAINQTLARGLATVGNDQPISPAYGEWYTNIGVRPRDVAKATALLTAAGYTKDKPLTVNLYASNYLGILDFATAFQQMSTDVPNVSVKIESEVIDTYYAADWLSVDFGITPWGARPAPQVYLDLMFKIDAIWNEGHYFNKQLDSLITAAGSELNVSRRKGLYAQIARIISDDGPSILPIYTVGSYPVRSRVQGFNPSPDTFHFYKTAWVTS